MVNVSRLYRGYNKATEGKQIKIKEEFNMIKKTFQLETLTCPSCASKIEGAVKRVPGVKEVQVLFNSSRVKIEFEESSKEVAQVRKTIEGLGYDVLGEK
ncbi:MAG: Heavy metal transport/detoxification protein [Clostridiales bacterium]|nr:Heavy metal transport/detoxification protein [Clostridiales bacterium]